MSRIETGQSAVGTRRAGMPPDPAAGPASAMPGLRSMLSTAELSARPSRPPDYAAENRALNALAQVLAPSPHDILQELAETALALCRAHSAGLSLLEEGDQGRNFHWRAIAGRWAEHVGGGTPRDFGPCGTVLDRNTALLCSHPERDFPYFGDVTPLLEEALLIPFYIQGKAVGTIWVVVHDTSRRFDAEDLRVMNSLGMFAAAAYQTVLNLNVVERGALIVESSNDAIVSKDLNGIITSWNRGAERIFGYAADEAVGQPITMLIPAQRLGEEEDILRRIARGEGVDHYETIRQCKDGRLIDVSLTISPIRDGSGKITGASKIARDITERKRADAQIALLAREVDHRAKNLLALVQATVQLTQADSVEDVKAAIQGRIQALARVHTVLARSHWAGADLHQLVLEQLEPYRQEGAHRAWADGPNLMLEPSAAQSIAMILHELATNAVKYGALSAPTGTVHVEWRCDADGHFVLRWAESGGPAVERPTRQGFGTRVIEQTVRSQLNGEARFDWRQDGLLCEIASKELPGGK